ncbi:MAG: tetratricopeptide repeat protein, partial [Ferruginibacter sp.]|nr:tetratricopeptide repeat protein [Chitinophagaceae bacterium]
KKLIWPKDTNALQDYRAFNRRYKDNPLAATMRRSMATALNERFNSIVGPLLKEETSYSSREECNYAAAELDSCLFLLGEQHYMYSNLKARKLFMEAMSLTWALNENEYNNSWKKTVLRSINLLEQSATLESNAAYTFSALGIHYSFLYEYDKANQAFQKYIDLRPNDYTAKFSLGLIYAKLKQYDKAESIFEMMLKEHPEDINTKLQLSDVYSNNNKPGKMLVLIDEMTAVDSSKMMGYFSKGVYYSKLIRPDSAVYYYTLAKTYFNGYCFICDNNIGHMYFVSNQIDSAKKYFKLILARDSTFPFANFNLGTIEQKEGNSPEAIRLFYQAYLHSTASLDGYITNFQLYLGKTYCPGKEEALREFSRKTHIVNMQYVSFLSILYSYVRVPGLIKNSENINFIFDQLFNYKQHDALTWYHHACYNALKQDKKTAMASLEKSLKLGFGSYFQLTCDNDLDLIRNTPEFKALVLKYFPGNR